jgi:hypothetical protein
MMLDMRGTVMYEKPAIAAVAYTVSEERPGEGSLVVAVTMTGDPGLAATFDITPGIAERQPMKEVGDGRYEGKFTFSPEMYGGPYWVTGRLRHDRAGEHIVRDPVPLTVTLPGR